MRRPRESLEGLSDQRREEMRHAYLAYGQVCIAAKAIRCSPVLMRAAVADLIKPRRKQDRKALVKMRMKMPVWEIAEKTGMSRAYLSTQLSIWKRDYGLVYPKFPARKSDC